MTFHFNTELASKYSNPTQIARILTEDWVLRNIYCPICKTPVLKHFEANRPVADFYCDNCKEQYELKSKKLAKGGIGYKIVDGEYNKMIERISSLNNPNFFFMTHYRGEVTNFVLIPKYFFSTSIIEKRKPLGPKAQRAGWTGCNILLHSIPEYGKIYIVKDHVELDHEQVHERYMQLASIRSVPLKKRGWLMDVLSCIEKLNREFSLTDMYAFVNFLQLKHPNNNNIEAKIRQQLQFLRNIGVIQFTTRGHYKRL